MADIIEEARARSHALRNDAARMAAEADEIDASISQILEGHRKLAAKLPKAPPARAVRAGNGKKRAPTMTNTIRDAVERLLQEIGGGPIPTADLVRLLDERCNIRVTGKMPINNLSAKLSLAKGRFVSHGRQGWALPSQSDNEESSGDSQCGLGSHDEGDRPTGST